MSAIILQAITLCTGSRTEVEKLALPGSSWELHKAAEPDLKAILSYSFALRRRAYYNHFLI
jgi:hypothetical protein